MYIERLGEPFWPVCAAIAPILCNGWTGTMYFCFYAGVLGLNSIETFETNFFVCASGIPDHIKMLKWRASIPHHSPTSCPKLRNSYKCYWDMDLDGHTRPITRCATGIRPEVNNNRCTHLSFCQHMTSSPV